MRFLSRAFGTHVFLISSLLNNVGLEVMLDGFFELLCIHFIPPSHLQRDSHMWMARRCLFTIYRMWKVLQWPLSKGLNLSLMMISFWKKCKVEHVVIFFFFFILPWNSICQQLADLGSSPSLSPAGHHGFWIILGICCRQVQLHSWSHKIGQSHGALQIRQTSRNHIINAHYHLKVCGL